MKSYEQLARAAYETYCKALSTANNGWCRNMVIDPWDTLPPGERAGWEAVARKVAEDLATVH